MIKLEDLRGGSVKLGRNADVVDFVNSLYKSISGMSLKQQRDWYINDRFLRGEHWVVYDKTADRIVSIPIDTGEIRRTINKVRSQVRGVKNFIKRSQPRFVVEPNDATDDAYDEANKKNKVVSNIYRGLKMPEVMTDLIVNSLKYSVGVMEAGVVEELGIKKIKAWVDDTFDVAFDPSAKNISDCRFLIKAVKRPVEQIINNKGYKVEDKQIGEDREAASDYKNVMEREKSNPEQRTGNDDLETTIVKELWLKYTKDNKIVVRVITIAGNNVLADQTTRYKRYPFFLYSPERSAGGIYGEPWIKDLISLNKSLDKTASKIESYIDRMLAGKWLIKQGTEVSTITDKGAEKIFYKGSTAPTQQNLQPLPAAPFNYLGQLERWIEELGGTREASLGRVPGSLQSGKAVEALQSADAGTVAEPIENLEFLLQDFGEFILELISEYQDTTNEVIEDNEKVSYIKASAENKPEGAISIFGNEKVHVQIVPEVAYSDDARKEWLMRLAEAKIIDEKTLLERFQFSNVGDIIDRVQINKEEEYKKEMLKQRESHRTDGNGPQDTADLADQENTQMAAGQEVPMTPRSIWSPEHLQLHMAFLSQDRMAYENNKELFDAHVLNEEQYK
jgi:hypothetical protein